MKRSSTVGIPSVRTPPPLFGIWCRLTGEGRYVPVSSCPRITSQFFHRYGSSSSVFIPSMPGPPLFFLTRFRAAFRFGRRSASSIRLLPGCPLPFAAGGASTLRPSREASPRLMNGSSSCPDFCGMAPSRLKRASPSFTFGLWLPRVCSFLASADSSLRPVARPLPFQARREVSPGKGHDPSPRSRRIYVDLGLGHRGFAGPRPLASPGDASHPVPVRQPAASLPASSPRSVALPQLRFASFAMACSREDFHLLGRLHAGRTGSGGRSPPVGKKEATAPLPFLPLRRPILRSHWQQARSPMLLAASPGSSRGSRGGTRTARLVAGVPVLL